MTIAQFNTTKPLFIQTILVTFNQSGALSGPSPSITIDSVVLDTSGSLASSSAQGATMKRIIITYSIRFNQPVAIGVFNSLMSFFNATVNSQEFTIMFSNAVESSCGSTPPAATCVHISPVVESLTVKSAETSQSATFAPLSKIPSTRGTTSSSSDSGSSILSLSPTWTIVVLTIVSFAFVVTVLFIIYLCVSHDRRVKGETFNLFSFDSHAMERESTSQIRDSTMGGSGVEMPRRSFFQRDYERDSIFGLMVSDDSGNSRASSSAPNSAPAPQGKRSSWVSRMAKILSAEPVNPETSLDGNNNSNSISNTNKDKDNKDEDDVEIVSGSNQSYNANSNQAFVEAYFSRKSSTNESDMFSGNRSSEYGARESMTKRLDFITQLFDDTTSSSKNPMEEEPMRDSASGPGEGRRNKGSVMQLDDNIHTMTL